MQDMFLKIDGIPGESTDAKHKDWIEVVSFGHEIIQPVATNKSTGGARSSERTEHGDFGITKRIDKATPILNKYASDGKHIPKVEFELCRATGDKACYMKYELTDVLISYVAIEREGSSQDIPLETVHMNYGSITWTYTETDHSTGATKGNVTAGWDLIANAQK